jgi:hypothetical protein
VEAGCCNDARGNRCTQSLNYSINPREQFGKYLLNLGLVCAEYGVIAAVPGNADIEMMQRGGQRIGISM